MSATNTDTANPKADSSAVVVAASKGDLGGIDFRQMVETMPINVMLLNPNDYTITYVNQTSKTTLAPLQSLLPCPVDGLVGQCVDIFHANPAHQRAILGDAANLPHQAKITLGDETLALRVSAVNDNDGHYMGAMLTREAVA